MSGAQKPRVTLADCPPGMFETLEGHWGFKTEYAHKSERDGRYYPEAYVVDSGEFFWGGATDHPERANLLVRPLDAEAIRHREAAEAEAKAREAALVEALVAAKNDLLAVGNDYPGSSCQKWCTERALAAWNVLEPWKHCPSTHCERSQECRSPNECSATRAAIANARGDA